jgi:hypothetical protein
VTSGGLILRVLTGRGAAILDPAVLGWAMLLQVVLALVLLAACCRKVRAPEQRAINLPLGLVLLLVWGIALALGMRFFEVVRWLFDWDEVWEWQWGGSVIALALIALFPLVAAASARHSTDRFATQQTGRRPAVLRPYDLVPVLLAALSGVLMEAFLPRDVAAQLWRHLDAPLWSWIGALTLAFLLSFWTDYALVYAACTRGRSPKLALIFSWLVLKILPVAADVISAVVTELGGERPKLAWLVAGVSPIGTLLVVTHDLDPWPGLALQGIIAAVATLIAGYALDSTRRRPTTESLVVAAKR